LWGSSESRFIYTITDYTEISVERETIADLLGYEDTWVPYGFLQVSEDVVTTLL
jgi:hypothetical protein